ncbi:TRAP transporter small permease [Castellaniella sp.]|uniref:TRAP transporter small permease n=1 Tax=Castellaniella sp. TaxID=1955812 RepID=UPI002B0007AE|nr:TRAP transporter small permease [Castellaniella sp.]
MKQIIEGFTKLLQCLIAVMLMIMVVLVFGNVVLRYGFNSGIIVSEEVSRMLFIWVTFLGSVLAMRENAHLGSNFVVNALGPKGRRASLLAGRLIMLYLCWLVFRGALTQTEINLSVAAPITGMSMGWFYSSGIVFSVLGALILLCDLFRLATAPASSVNRFLDNAGEQA